MKKQSYRLVVFLALATIFVWVVAPAGHAQQPDIEVNNSALETYQPPPMFGTVEKPVLSRPLDPGWSPQLTRESEKREKVKEVLPRLEKPEKSLSAETLLNAPESMGAITGPSVIKKRVLKKSNDINVAKHVPDNVPLPPRKMIAIGQVLADVPMPERKPTFKQRIKTASKTVKKKSDSPTLVLKRPAQIDVPKMPAVPAGAVKKEVLYLETSKPESVERISLEFPRGSSDLTRAHKAELDKTITLILANNSALKLLVSAFARPADETVSSARRVSLSRALSVRSHLIENGIDPARIEVRALGSDTKREPVDRIDLVFLSTVN